MTKIENEYGSYGNDLRYLEHLRDGMVGRGVDCLLFTSDGPTDAMLQGGSVPGVPATANFGSRPGTSLAALRRYQKTGPLTCMEYWNGWFDQWGGPHHVRDAQDAANVLDEMLAAGASVNIYMGHGGTNFGFMSGANHDGRYTATITSYDYDAPVGEAGELTEKFHLFRKVIAKHLGPNPHPLPPLQPRLAPATVRPAKSARLFDSLDALSETHRRTTPEPMEAFGQATGFIHYRTHISGPRPEAGLFVDGLADRAQVFLDGEPIAVLDHDAQHGTPMAIGDDGTVLDVLVENRGRVNYGPELADRKGISGGVRLANQFLFDWEIRPLQLDDLSTLAFTAHDALPAGPAFHHAELTIDEPADGFIALPGWTKGAVWLNGFNLGRYSQAGPQRTLYAPTPLWRAGHNEIVVLELHQPGTEIELCGEPDLGPVAAAPDVV
ncbi:beta-galactosidase [Kitasatospora griseola]|uniref:beta-galactosidase n=1 Tax=Kitasatospora griseola TaxID=2064 RepID=UPI003806435B